MSVLTETDHIRPQSLDSAIAARAARPQWTILAGGTDLMVGGPPDTGSRGVLDVFGLAELHGVRTEVGTVHIGACTTYAELLADDTVATVLPLLRAAAADVAAPQIRARGTIGGNVMSCSPVGDMLPGLLALDAVVVLASERGQRWVRYERFVTGYRRVDLRPDELLVTIEVPVPRAGTVQHWRKVGTRRAQAITKVSLAATAHLSAGRIDHLRLAFGAVADRPLRLHHAEDLAFGGRPDDVLAERVRSAVATALSPIDDVRSTSDYRRDVAAVLAARFVAGLTSAGDR